MLKELATDKASLIQLVKDDAAHGIDSKIWRNGGLITARCQRDICIAAGFTMFIGDTAGPDITFATIIHLSQRLPLRALEVVMGSRRRLRTVISKYVKATSFTTQHSWTGHQGPR